MRIRLVLGTLLAFSLAFLAHSPVLAAGEKPARPYYVVQPGDTISAIAFAFGVDEGDLLTANHIADPNSLRAGQRLLIPGLEGVTGRLVIQKTSFGVSLNSLSRALGVSVQTLARINHLVSPAQLYAGKPIILPANSVPIQGRRVLVEKESLLDLAIRTKQSPWALLLSNKLPARWDVLPGDVLLVPGKQKADEAPFSAFPSNMEASIKPGEWIQGRTGEVVISVNGKVAQVDGRFDGRALPFFQWKTSPQTWVALRGIFALAKPGIYPLVLRVRFADGSSFGFAQSVRVVAGNYYYEKLQVPPNLLSPDLNRSEERFLEQKTATATKRRYWSGKFLPPEKPPFSDCHPSYFGARRNYNSGAFFWYHTGLDFCGRVGTPIYAPADGKVVFVGKTEIHGNVTVIDHGWGVYTLYCHQSQPLVEVGQIVHAGELIGRVGRTGRVTGPHLHWEVRIDGIPVDPQEWLTRIFP